MTHAVDARDRYVAEFRRFAENGAGAGPGWLKELRQAGIERFAAVGFPTTRQEEWRFTDIAPLIQTPFTLPTAPDTQASPEMVERILDGPTGARLVFVDGGFRPELSVATGLPSGVKLGSLGDAVRRDGDVLAAHLGRYASVERNPFTALSAAFLREGAFVHVTRGVSVEQPIHLLFLASGAAQGRMIHPRNLIVLEREAQATVVETYAAEDAGPHLTNAVTEFAVEDGARGRHVRIQREGDGAFHMATSQSHQGKDTSFSSCSVAFGAGLSRHDVNAVLAGTGGLLLLNGLSVLAGRQHVDYHTTIDHARPHCESHELFNGILAERARGVFNGRIIVRPGAQQTDSKQTNNNVLLSEAARADSQPQLEIYADDVKCTHGATIGPLDPNALFYLETRGVGAEAARQLMTYGFAADIVSRIDVPEVRERLDRLVRARLAA
ncbi:MAG: Fe-S cluster assembly protein SufD [Gemmatimonadetes bacterium]|nr:Fe-S cluster assembly protein SufD [Gemmatimonadota bacterium]